MGVAHNGMKVLYGDNFVAQSALFSAHHSLAQARYRRYFKTQVYTGQSCNALILRDEQLSQRIDQQAPYLHHALERYFDQFDLQATSDVVYQVERLVLRMMPIQRCRLSNSACIYVCCNAGWPRRGEASTKLSRRCAASVPITIWRKDTCLCLRLPVFSATANRVCSIALASAGFSRRLASGAASCSNEIGYVPRLLTA